MLRRAGVVVPLSSIRTRRDWGIGQITDLPACAQWVLGAGQRLVQVLPPHELSVGETSPYGALTAFGLDPIYLDVEALEDLDPTGVREALGPEGRAELDRVRAASRVDYAAVRALKTRVLRAAFDRFFDKDWPHRTARAKKLTDFMAKEKEWLDDVALYVALREARALAGWKTWPEDQRERSQSALYKARADHARRIVEVGYEQWQLSEQWDQARSQMSALGVELMGDVPFIVGTESADVWSHAGQFQLNVSLGAPPDDYSADGQDWGLPAFDWLAMEADNLRWIRARTRRAARLYDRFRLDHVVGYFRQWVRPRGAAKGRFDPEGSDAQGARGGRVLRAMLDELGRDGARIEPPRAVAEDLGVIPDFVRQSLRQLGLPGYRVLPWERDGAVFRDPTSFPKTSVACWSTHDTAPIDAWWDDFSKEDRKVLSKRASVPEEASRDELSLALLGDLFRSRSDLCLLLAQELLGVRDRINVPATVGPQNWTWRLPSPIEDLQNDARVTTRFDAIRRLVEASGRRMQR